MLTLWGEDNTIETKICRDCNIEKAIEEFEPNRRFYSKDNPNGRVVRRPSCRTCRSKKKTIKRSQSKHWKRPQTFECPVCKHVYDGSYARLDHCHDTGNVRGWLCDNCNTGFGKFREDIGILRNAVRYLEGSIHEVLCGE